MPQFHGMTFRDTQIRMNIFFMGMDVKIVARRQTVADSKIGNTQSFLLVIYVNCNVTIQFFSLRDWFLFLIVLSLGWTCDQTSFGQ